MAGNPNAKIRAANEGLTRTLPNGKLDWTGVMRMLPDRLTVPLRKRKPTKYFVNSLSDLFHEDVPFEYIAACFGIMAACPQHTFQILTKRPDRAVEFFAWAAIDRGTTITRWVQSCAEHFVGKLPSSNPQPWPLPNVWIGESIAEQKDADKNIPHLSQIPAAVRFLSVEPLIGPVDISLRLPPCDHPSSDGDGRGGWICTLCGGRHHTKETPNDPRFTSRTVDDQPGIGWVIAGGESGPGARPMHPDWVRSLRDQCVAAGVPFFFKQWGAWRPPLDGEPFDTLPGRAQRTPTFLVNRSDGTVRCTQPAAGPDAAVMLNVGKKKAGRLLDGRTWDEMPEVRS